MPVISIESVNAVRNRPCAVSPVAKRRTKYIQKLVEKDPAREVIDVPRMETMRVGRRPKESERIPARYEPIFGERER